MLPRLSYFLLFLLLLSFIHDNRPAATQELQPVEKAISKQKVLPLAMQYRLQIIQEIESSPLIPDQLADPTQTYCSILDPERPFALASSDPLIGFMSMQI